jgi:asparagine synthase (glutamine-hydrolysing)
MEPALPHELLYRPKMGFGVPLGQWFRGPLAARARTALAGGLIAESGIFNLDYVSGLVASHQSGRRDYSAPIWTLLMFDAFLRNVVEGSTGAERVGKAA